MYSVHLYGVHEYCAIVDLGSSGSPGVRPTPGLTSSTQVVCACVRAYTSTHTPDKTRATNGENAFLLRVASVAKHKCDLWTNWMRPAPTRMIGWCLCNTAVATASWASADSDRFLERTASRNGLPARRWAVGRAVNNSLHDVRARLEISSQ